MLYFTFLDLKWNLILDWIFSSGYFGLCLQKSAGAGKMSPSSTQSLHHSLCITVKMLQYCLVIADSAGCCWGKGLVWNTIIWPQLLPVSPHLRFVESHLQGDLQANTTFKCFPLFSVIKVENNGCKQRFQPLFIKTALCLWGKLSALWEVAAPVAVEGCKLYDIKLPLSFDCVTTHRAAVAVSSLLLLLLIQFISHRLRGEKKWHLTQWTLEEWNHNAF